MYKNINILKIPILTVLKMYVNLTYLQNYNCPINSRSYFSH